MLDKNFKPMVKTAYEFVHKAQEIAAQDIAIAIERNNGYISTYKTKIYCDGIGKDNENCKFIERMTKALLWIRGGYKIIIGGSPIVYDFLKKAYTKDGLRKFDVDFMSTVYERDFVVENVTFDDTPQTSEATEEIGRHLDGYRIGFDAGGSDRKVSAVINGEAVYSEEVVWYPKTNSNPDYHHNGILEAMKTAASHMPRVDAIGVSSAGVYVDNRIMVASLFLKVAKDDFNKKVKNMYIDIAKEIADVPILVANDGDVTALAGAMDLNDDSVLGIAMGTSEAGGYVDKKGNITGWLNELAFVPVDFNENAMIDEWSGDYGCGVKYFSQDAVIKLAPLAGIKLDETLSPAEKLKTVQKLLEEGHSGAKEIFETIGVYFAYAVAFYDMFYDIKHVLILGRVTSGEGGNLIIKNASKTLEKEFPELASKIKMSLPDENNRRVGQSIAAASLPLIK